MNKWFHSPLGHFAAYEFAVTIDSLNGSLKGGTLVQLGNCGENSWLKKMKYTHKWIVSPFALAHKIHIESELNHLPFSRDSVDCIIAPLTLEPFGSSFSLIDEIDRVLKPMGLVVFLCINPWSLWGAAMKSGLLHCYRDSHVKMRTPFSLNRVFIQRGYEQISLSNFCYIPPVSKASLIKKLTFLDEIGKMLWPVPSGFYCYVAQKHQLILPSLMSKSLSQPINDYRPSLQPVTLSPIEK